MSKLTERELQSLRNLGNEAEQAADRIEHLERVLVMAKLAIEALDEGHYHIGSEALAAIDEALKEKFTLPTAKGPDS